MLMSRQIFPGSRKHGLDRICERLDIEIGNRHRSIDDVLLTAQAFLKLRVREGHSVPEAAKLASRQRFRAVLLTSLTTIAGLLPLLSERSLQAQVLIPLVTSIVFGLLASTLLVLLVVPALFSILDDLGGVAETPAPSSSE